MLLGVKIGIALTIAIPAAAVSHMRPGMERVIRVHFFLMQLPCILAHPLDTTQGLCDTAGRYDA
jgi:hypothetical protein